jgi:predicted Zn-dependent protease
MERIEDMARRNPRPSQPYDNSEFLRIKARLEALYEPTEEVLRRLKTRHEENHQDPLPVYGLALAQMRQGRYDLSLAYLEVLGRLWKNSPLVWREQARCHLLTGEYAQARDLYARVVSQRPEDQAALSGLAQAYLRTDQLEQARQALLRLVKLDPEADQALYDLGVVVAKQRQTAEGSLYLGQAFFKRGNWRTARFHLTKAVAGLADQPELLRQAQADMERLEEKTEADKKKKIEEEKKRREEKERQEEEDRRRGGTPPWGVSRP